MRSVQAAIAALEPVTDAAMTYFYGQVYAMEPEIAAMFPAGPGGQRHRFFRALAEATVRRDEGDLARLALTNRKYGVRDQHYQTFERALRATLRRFAAAHWNAETDTAFAEAFAQVAGAMTGAAAQAARDTPAWWVATIVDVDRRGPGITVLTVKPDQPVPYRAGQFVSIQTPKLPRVWRSYSVANAPRPDGLLSFHIRAVGGTASRVLTGQLQPGDPLLVAGPDGSMTPDLDSGRHVLCLAGGTGLAPVKAIIEALIASEARVSQPGRRREIALYLGARRRQDLYDLPALRRMERDYPWLQVLPALSEEQSEDLLSGTIPDLITQASWRDRDVYLAGPDPMIQACVSVLHRLGAQPELLHYDLITG